MRDVLRTIRYFRPDGRRIGFVISLLFVGVGFNLLKPWPLALIVDSVLGNKPLPQWLDSLADWNKTLLLGILSAAIFILHFSQGALSAAQNYGSIRIGLRGLTRVRNEVFDWMQRLSLRYYQGTLAGDLIYRASWDTYSFQTLFQQGFMAFVAAALSLLLMVVVMAKLNRDLTLVAISLVPALFVVMKVFGKKMRDQTSVAQQTDSKVSSLVQQSISSLALIQSYTREERESEVFKAQTRNAEEKRLSQHGWELAYWFAIAVVFGVGAALITWLGARQVSAGELTLGQLLIFLAYLGQLYEPLNQLSHVGATVAGARAGARRIFEILDTPEDVQDKPGSRPIASQTARSPNASALILKGDVEFDHVWFRYQPECEVLRDITFSIRAGESLAIIGPSGAGKTTLLNLLPRFFDPVSGSVKLDGVDLRELRLKDLRAHVALVSQESLIVPGTVAENIAFGNPDATAQEIKTAAARANADLFIDNLPEKYETRIGEGATRLSVGERQRISLARAFLKDAPILLLDEPTSALDSESEAAIEASLQDLTRGRTTIIVAHRLSTIARTQKILVLEQGKVTEFGTPAQLRSTGGYYARVLAQTNRPNPS